METGYMSKTEVERYAVIRRVLDGGLKQRQAGQMLGLSSRQVKRLCKQVRTSGSEGLVSKKKGAQGNHRISLEEREKYLEIVRCQYADFGPTLAAEYLRKHHEFPYACESLRGWMIESGLWNAKRRRIKKVHSLRERRACFGELIQIDGSPHDWFEGRGDKCCLIAFIDDATSQVLMGKFYGTESGEGYFDLLAEHVKRYGRPLAFYSDRHSVFTTNNEAQKGCTQFERALLQLEIESILALSPQAKGRVERLFKTLQDRMVKAMRLAKINDIAQANAWLPGYLEEHNLRFSVAAREETDMHRSFAGSSIELERICAWHHKRVLSQGLHCDFEGDIIQIKKTSQGGLKAGREVQIIEYADKRIEVLHAGLVLDHKRYEWIKHAPGRVTEGKGLVSKVDQLKAKEQKRLGRLTAQIAHEEDQRSQGVFLRDVD